MSTDLPNLTRRQALKSVSSGFGYLAFASLATQAANSRRTHFPARAKRVIFLCMKGGPSHVDTFDYKPELQKRSGEKADLGRYASTLLGSPFQFQQHGESGLWISELFPHLAKHADDLCLINSMQTDLPNHPQAFGQMHTGSFQFVRPSLGAWTLYGLGTGNENLPGFITLNPPADFGGARNYGSAFLPAIHQGTRIGGGQIPELYAALLKKDEEPGPPLKYLESGSSRQEQRAQLDLIRQLNQQKLQRDSHNPEIEGAIESFELAFRMQGEVPNVLDLNAETEETRQLYGIGQAGVSDRFARQCLLARRLSEAGVRFVEITAPENWDHHFLLEENLTRSCVATDQPIAGLLADLKRRGLLKDTLVIWAGEFGRTPYVQGGGNGRDHNNKGYSMWMAGGGVKGGYVHGATDEFGHKAIENPVHIHDWHATILHLLGLDHQRLTYNYAGREFRLTDVYGDVVTEIIS